MRVLVTGADGFVGTRVVSQLVAAGHDVTAAVGVGAVRRPAAAEVVELELRLAASVHACTQPGYDWVLHLAAVASGTDARQDPGLAWDVNAAGTARLCEALARTGPPPDRVLVVSTAEVYGRGSGARARQESDPPAPLSPYAGSKLGGEIAALEVWRRTGLSVFVARAFPHTGAGQDERFVVPAFARRLREAKRDGSAKVPVGNLDVVRDVLHVDDVVGAYLRLMTAAEPGEVYNVASGQGLTIRALFERLAELVGVVAEPEPHPALLRPADIEHLVGDASKLMRATGWTPRRTVDEALIEVVGAQAN